MWFYAQTDVSRVVDCIGEIVYIATLIIVVAVVAQQCVQTVALACEVGHAELFSAF